MSNVFLNRKHEIEIRIGVIKAFWKFLSNQIDHAFHVSSLMQFELDLLLNAIIRASVATSLLLLLLLFFWPFRIKYAIACSMQSFSTFHSGLWLNNANAFFHRIVWLILLGRCCCCANALIACNKWKWKFCSHFSRTPGNKDGYRLRKFCRTRPVSAGMGCVYCILHLPPAIPAHLENCSIAFTFPTCLFGCDPKWRTTIYKFMNFVWFGNIFWL